MRRQYDDIPNIFKGIYCINVRTDGAKLTSPEDERDLLYIQDDFWFALGHRCFDSNDAERLLEITAEDVSMLVLKYGGINSGTYHGVYNRMNINPPWRH